MPYPLRFALYLLGVVVALIVQQLVHDVMAGVIIGVAIYLPIHNWYWGRP